MDAIRKNEVYTVTIGGYSSEGLGVARVGGQVLFVHGGIAGEECDVLVMKVLKHAAYGKAMTVRRPSPHRTEPACPYFGKCGGCAFWHMDYEEELSAKRQKVWDALERLGGQTPPELPIFPSPSMLHYRNKVQYPVAPPHQIGFYRARSHQVIEVEHCLIQSAAADRIAAAVRDWMTEHRAAAYDETTGKGWLRHLYIRTAQKGATLVCLVAAGKGVPAEDALIGAVRTAWPDTAGIVLNVNARPGNGILGTEYRTLWGAAELEDTLCGHVFALSVPSFYQVNHDQAEQLYALAVEFANLKGDETALELYCGAGTITLALAEAAGRVIGAEIVPEAIENAKANAARNGISNVEFFCGDAGETAQKCAAEGLRPDVVVVDPPRKGPNWLPHFLSLLLEHDKNGHANRLYPTGKRKWPLGKSTRVHRKPAADAAGFFTLFFLPALQRVPWGQGHPRPGRAARYRRRQPQCCRPCAPGQQCREFSAPGTGAGCVLCSLLR